MKLKCIIPMELTTFEAIHYRGYSPKVWYEEGVTMGDYYRWFFMNRKDYTSSEVIKFKSYLSKQIMRK